MIDPNSYKIEKFEVGDYDIRESVSQLKYYESVLSPAITFEAVIAENDGILSGNRGGGGLKGGELAKIKINGPTGGSSPLEFNNLYLRKISSVTPDSRTNVYILTFTTAGALINETSRCSMKYTGKISDIVSSILNSTVASDSSIDTDIETTQNTYSFIGNARKPFHTITWLAKKAIPQQGGGITNTQGTAGFFFYEDRDGYKFVSVDSLISGDFSENAGTLTYEQTDSKEPTDDGRYKILSYSYDTNFDLLENLRLGMFSNINYFYSPFDQTTQCYQYNLKDSYAGQIKTLDPAADPYAVPLGLDESPSRVMVAILDQGTLEPTGKIEELETVSQDQPKYQAQAVVRYNLLFSQTVSITVPSNLTLKIGDTITCNFITAGAKPDTIRSGKYLVAELSHQFSDNKGYTGLRLIRDSYGG